jgi:OOP family OmpA-OmpF porin
MNKLLLSMATATLVLAGGAAQAGSYLEVMGGPTFDPSLPYGGLKFNMKTGYNVGGAIGTSLDNWFGPDWAVQGDVLYTSSQYSGFASHMSSTSVMGDIVYNWKNSSAWTPYIGAGLGAVDVDYRSTQFPTFQGDAWAFGYQGFVGLDVSVAHDVSLFGEYRYQGASKVTVKGTSDIGYESNNLTFGVKVDL